MKKLTPILPYIAVLIGMYIFRNAWAAILLYHAGMIVILISDKNNHYKSQIYKGWQWRWGIPVVSASILGGVLIYVLWPYMAFDQEGLFKLLADYGLKGNLWYAFVIYYALLHPPLEQIFWRGYLYQPSSKVHWIDACFAGYHILTMIPFVKWPWAVVSAVILMMTAWLWRQLIRWTGGLIIPILSHLIADVCVIGAVVVLTV